MELARYHGNAGSDFPPPNPPTRPLSSKGNIRAGDIFGASLFLRYGAMSSNKQQLELENKY